MTRPLHRSVEIFVAGVALLGLGFLLLTPHVRHGGFYYDDWGNAAAYHFEGWWRASVFKWRHGIPGRPILAFLLPLPYALFGLDPSYHLAAAVVLAALTSLSFFAFLRTLGVEFPHALAMALLSLMLSMGGRGASLADWSNEQRGSHCVFPWLHRGIAGRRRSGMTAAATR